MADRSISADDEVVSLANDPVFMFRDRNSILFDDRGHFPRIVFSEIV